MGVQGLHERKVMITSSQPASRLVEILDALDNGTLVDYHDTMNSMYFLSL